MSEVATRPAPTRGRGSTRGRGGFRGSNRTRDQKSNGDFKEPDETDQGELGAMKKQYSSQLSSLKELFAEWNDIDLLFALQETDGDLDRAIDHISEGNVSQFSSVKKKAKDRSRSKVPEAADSTSRPPRGRGASENVRSTRGRSERGRGAPRAARGGAQHTNGTRNVTGPPATTDSWGSEIPSFDEPAPAPHKAPPEVKPVPTGPPKKTWASMFAKPTPAPPKAVEPEAATPQDAGTMPSSDISSGYVEVTHSDADLEATPVPSEEPPTPDAPSAPDRDADEPDTSSIDLPPSKDKLTEDNVEHLPDDSKPAPTGTAASTVESSRGPDSATPSVVAQASQQAPIGRPALTGYAATAMKATAAQPRSASFQRRLMEQQEAVVMPGHHAVDRAAVQFGSLGLNGDANPLDVDEDREEAETRAQPPQHSPVAPKTSLPPAPRADALPQEPTQIKPAPGLPPVAQQQPNPQQASASPLVSQSIGQQNQQNQGFNQFGRYGQTEGAGQKSFDPFPSAAAVQQSPFDSYTNAQSQNQQQGQQQPASQIGAFSSTGSNDFSNYYTADQRASYNNYYGGYGQNNTSQQEAGAAQQRATSGFGSSAADNGFPSSQAQAPGRFGEAAQHSGHNTPNPTAAAGQHSTGQNQQQMHQHGHGAQGQQHFPYNSHPYYNQPYYTNYMNQYPSYNQQNFSQFGKGMYGQPHQGYGMPQSSFDQHSSTPAMAGGFGQRDGGLGSGLGSDYARSGSTQPQGQNAGAGGFGDVFGRSPGSFPGQGQSFGQQGAGQQGSTEDSLKPFADKASGAAASSLGQPGRPTSAANNANQTGQGLPPPQSHQGFGGYPNQFSQMQSGQSSQYGGLGGLGGHQGSGQPHQTGGYGGGYGAGFGSNYQQSYGNRSGWGGNYQGH